ncbi:MAG: preprotein translocase subunit YajC [Acidimicrobiales bacterium]|nr:preprotein translocase subunit YajC [Acidimicrobiales bacterium]MDG1844810.1 preprotein translocase subunit YajC [Acidimicrobiales bacterium]
MRTDRIIFADRTKAMGVAFIPILLVIMYFLILRPQQKRLKEQRAMLNLIDVGDDVRTDSGIYGTVSDLDGDTIFLMIADGVEIKISKASIAELVSYDDSYDED